MITISKLQVHDRLSEETMAMNCDVLWQGRRIATAKNCGQGGCTDLYDVGSKEDLKAAEAFVATKPLMLDGRQMEINGKLCFHTIDTYVEELAAEQHATKKTLAYIKRSKNKKTIFVVGDEVREAKAAFSPDVENFILGKYPTAIILSTMSDAEAAKAVLEAEDRATKASLKKFRESLDRK